jgi:hypothetical protein
VRQGAWIEIAQLELRRARPRARCSRIATSHRTAATCSDQAQPPSCCGMERTAASEAPKTRRMAKLMTLITAKGMFSRNRTFASNQSVTEKTFENGRYRQSVGKNWRESLEQTRFPRGGHGRACPGHPDQKARPCPVIGVAGTSPAMTARGCGAAQVLPTSSSAARTSCPSGRRSSSRIVKWSAPGIGSSGPGAFAAVRYAWRSRLSSTRAGSSAVP